MRLLITNNTLAERAGSELWVRDVALALKSRGDQPVCFSMTLGEVADELRKEGVEVVSSLAAAHGPFDLIHGHHRIETTLAAMAFPRVPVISFCHGPKAWQESPCVMPNVVRHVAVDEACKQRLINEGIDEAGITLLLNFADTGRFLPRAPLPSRPRRALVFSNNARPDGHAAVVREACAKFDIEVEVRGRHAGQVASKPEEVLPHFDLVFAKARAAIEAMAVGCAVVQCDYFGAGWLVTSERFATLRPLNFGYLSMSQPVTVEHLAGQIAAYDAADAAAVSRRVREEASLEKFLPGLLDLYAQALAAPLPGFDPWEAGSAFIQEEIALAKAGVETRGLEKEMGAARQHIAELQAKLAEQKKKRERLNAEKQKLKDNIHALKQQLAEARQTRRRAWKFWL